MDIDFSFLKDEGWEGDESEARRFLHNRMSGIVHESMMTRELADQLPLPAFMELKMAADNLVSAVHSMAAPFIFSPADPAGWYIDASIRDDYGDRIREILDGNREAALELREMAQKMIPLISTRHYTDLKTWRSADPVDEMAELFIDQWWESAWLFTATLKGVLSLGDDGLLYVGKILNGVEGGVFLTWYSRLLVAVERLSNASAQAVTEAKDRLS